MSRIETGYIKSISDKQIIELDNYFSKCEPPIKLTYMWMRHFGLRVSDAVSIKIENIQEGKLIKEMVKTKKIIELPIPTEILLFLNQYISFFRKKITKANGYLAFSKYNEHIQTGTIRTHFKIFRDKYGYNTPYRIKTSGQKQFNMTPHALRHFVADELYKKTNNVKLIQTILGHKKSSTTIDRYIGKTSNKTMLEALKDLL